MEATIANIDLGRYRRVVQMFWDPEPLNDETADCPVWCLGRSYQLHGNINNPKTIQDTEETPETRQGQVASSDVSNDTDRNGDGGWPSDFIRDFESKFWMTYRSDFPAIPRPRPIQSIASIAMQVKSKLQLGDWDNDNLTSDTGWGCMIRSGQSLFANTLSILKLGRGWRKGSRELEEKQIISLFADDPKAQYSIHNFVRHGASACGKLPGEWFGPSATARCIQALANSHDKNLRVYSAGDGQDVYEDAFMNTAKIGNRFQPTLVLVGTRLGIDKITPVYWEALISALQMPQSVGIAGGRPSSSHYFIGAQGSFLFYLDPHHTRTALPYRADVNSYTQDEIESCHTSRLRRLHVREMDPSMLIGFLIRDEEDWESWKRGVKHVQGKAIIHVAETGSTPGTIGGAREDAISEVEAMSDNSSESELRI